MLTNDEMRLMAESLLNALVRYRAIARETLGDGFEAVAKLQHWSLGGDLIPALEKIIAAPIIDRGDFYNMLVIAKTLAPEIGMAVSVLQGRDLPDPSEFLRGATT